MTPQKRLFDLGLALVLIVLLALPVLILSVALLATQGRPLLYGSERMRSFEQGFTLWKFRSMKVVDTDSGVSGGDKADRITPMGQILRGSRLDEIPQLWNILKGDISFVGPRPPLRQYVERFPEAYRPVLRSRPGVTGLATLRFHAREQALLAPCRTAAETDAVYARRCVPAKAALDLIYQRHASVCFDAVLIWETVARVLLKRK